MIIFVIAACQVITENQANQANQANQVSSPDGSLYLALNVENQSAVYSVIDNNNQVIISPSNLGLILNGEALIVESISKISEEKITESFAIQGNYAKVNSIRHHKIFEIVHSNGVFKLEVSASNHGIAFRYIIDNPNANTITVNQELTEFNLPDNALIWAAEDYEEQWLSQQLKVLHKDTNMTFPVVIENQQQYLLITQAKHHNYGATHLKKNDKNGLKTAFGRFAYDDKSFTLTENIVSPWRVIMINSSLNTLANNSLVYELADPVKPELKNARWIKPGRSGWAWVSGGFLGQNYENMKAHIDYVADLGWEYMIIDDGWEHWPNKWEKITELTALGKAKGVGIILWKPTGDYQAEWQLKKFGSLPVIEGMLDYPKRDQLFTKAKQAGVAGFKVDFVNENNLERVNFFKDVLEHAARYQLVINFHGSNLPTGLERTYPNELTRESVRGMEHVWKKDSLFTLNTILPFTRYVVGHGDYTPVLGAEQETAGTRTHQLGTAITFNSPLNAFAVHPKKLLFLPEAELLKSIPTIWDETRVLSDSKIGSIAIMAKRKADIWYLSVLNGDKASTVKIALNEFLSSGSYRILRYQDTNEVNGIVKSTDTVTSHGVITETLKVGGGFVARFTPNKK